MEKEPLLRYSSATNTPGQDGDGHRGGSLFSWLRLRYGKTRKCVSSKAALLILLWSFILGLWNAFALSPDAYIKAFPFAYKVFLIGFAIAAFVVCFFPLAGFLADIKCGRHKTVVTSLFLLWISVPLMLLVAGAIGGSVFAVPDDVNIGLIVAFSVCGFVVSVLSYIGVVGFTANVIQYGMDQLHDSPGEDRTLFIHWYVWTYYLSILISQLGWVLLGNGSLYYDDLSFSQLVFGFLIVGLVPLVVIVVLPITLCLVRRRRRWFLIEPGMVNPYKLVYRVTKFARQHKVPVNRSAFTYCEDEVPTGLNLAKDKYGGPFTTEQVEGVKAFYGILRVLFSFGMIFSVDIAAESLLTIYSTRTSLACALNCNHTEECFVAKQVLFISGLFSPLLTVVCIPLYLCLLRPIMTHHLSMLRRIGLGILLSVLSVVALFSLDLAAHEGEHNNLECMFTLSYFANHTCSQDPEYLIFPLTLLSFSHMLIYPAAFEFICSQSPHSMKGLLIGLLYTIKGLFQLLATAFVVPFAAGRLNSAAPSCGFYYYLTNIVFGFLGFVLFVWVSKRYQFRERDEPSNIHRYAEEYYSNPQREEGFDFSYSQLLKFVSICAILNILCVLCFFFLCACFAGNYLSVYIQGLL